MLVPVSVLLFVAIMKTRVTVPLARALRQFSTVIYCFHGSLAVVLGGVIRKLGINTEALFGAVLQYVLVVAGCIAAALLIRKLQKIRGLAVLRYFM
jgi:surface polysaccharide O-acyltransferase-like enzyme